MNYVRFDSNTIEHALESAGAAAVPAFWLFCLASDASFEVPSFCEVLSNFFDQTARNVGAMDRRSDDLVNALKDWALAEDRPEFVLVIGQQVAGPLIAGFANDDDELTELARAVAWWIREMDRAEGGITVLSYLLLPSDLMGAVDAALDPQRGAGH